MKSLIQAKPTVGYAAPYNLDEWIRSASRGTYIEIELPIPNQGRTGSPDGYLVLNMIRDQSSSLLVAYNGDDLNKVIDEIYRKKEYIQAFRQQWAVFNSLYADSNQVNVEIRKRPLLLTVIDPDDNRKKWMVGRRVVLQGNFMTEVTQEELGAMDSLITPALTLNAEAKDVGMRVFGMFINGDYQFPKSSFDKFKDTVDKVANIADLFKGS